MSENVSGAHTAVDRSSSLDVIPEAELVQDKFYRPVGIPGFAGLFGAGFMGSIPRAHDVYDWLTHQYNVIYVLRGEGTYIDWNGREHPMLPGDLVHRIPGKVHSTVHVQDGTWAECFFVFPDPVFESLAATKCIDPNRARYQPGLSLFIVREFRRICNALKEASELEVRELMAEAQRIVMRLLIMDRDRRGGNPHEDAIEEACQILAENLADRRPVPELLRPLPIGYERLRKLFVQRIGVAPKQYRIHRRIEAAAEMIISRGLSLKETAARLGYPDVFTFSKQFRRATGVSPGRFPRTRRP